MSGSVPERSTCPCRQTGWYRAIRSLPAKAGTPASRHARQCAGRQQLSCRQRSPFSGACGIDPVHSPFRPRRSHGI
ncbi:hypothetical protein, partial [Komagataeibacter saccharivorans]|uniref:hypothetical protein n=1 Tax=Komagataeibacter saccharivorans TaxID=265959 RepID=UPI0039ED87C7